MRPIDRAAVTYLNGLRVGQATTACRECGKELPSGARVWGVARRPRSASDGRWHAHLFCNECRTHATPDRTDGVDEFVAVGELVSTPVTASGVAALTVANVSIEDRSLAYGRGASDAHAAAEGL